MGNINTAFITRESKFVDYQGVFEDGVIRPLEPVELPPGTRVEFHAIPDDMLGDHADDFWATPGRKLIERDSSEYVPPSISDLRGDWPAEDSIDEFLAAIREWRR